MSEKLTPVYRLSLEDLTCDHEPGCDKPATHVLVYWFSEGFLHYMACEDHAEPSNTLYIQEEGTGLKNN